MRGRRRFGLLLAGWLAAIVFASPAYATDAVDIAAARRRVTEGERRERALLIGVDDFVSRPSAYPSSTNNVYSMQETFQGALNPLEALLIPDDPVSSVEELGSLIQDTFGDADQDDVSYLYLSTHGIYDPLSGSDAVLLLSDGMTEENLTARQLEDAFDGIEGTKVLILDACNSGAFIGKGMPVRSELPAFLGEDFKVLTSSGALEESWYWSASEMEKTQVLPGALPTPQGAFYFTQTLSQALSARYGYPADTNHDGDVTLRELYEYLLQNHAASTPQVYPQEDDFVVFRYDAGAPLPTGLERSPIVDVTFSGSVLSGGGRNVTLEYIVTRPVRVGYQIVYQRDGKWEFDKAKILFDDVERYTAFGDQRGAVSAGRKVRTLTVDPTLGDASGYVLVQLLSIDRGRLTVHAGQVLCVPPTEGDLHLSVTVADSYRRDEDRELSIFVAHAFPCALSVAIVNEDGDIVRRISHRRGTRPAQTDPAGSLFYWDGTDKNGEPVAPGRYRVRASGVMNDVTSTVVSDVIEIQ